MRFIKIEIAYDGTCYHGFQIQPNCNTIEHELNLAISKTTKEDIHIIGASRTDSLVHARGQIALFLTNSKIPIEKFPLAINSRLPKDIVVTNGWEVDENFHPRYNAKEKVYTYKIYNSKIPNPLVRNYSLYYYYDLNIDKMIEASKILIGEHDFKSFCNSRSDKENTVRNIYDIIIKKEGNFITLTYIGNGFLYNMVRLITGTLIKVGSGYFNKDEVLKILNKKEKGYCKYNISGCGLCLEKIKY